MLLLGFLHACMGIHQKSVSNEIIKKLLELVKERESK